MAMGIRTLFLAAIAALTLSGTTNAITIFDANNEGFALGSTPPTTGAPDAPSSIDPNLTLIVENGASVSTPNLGPDQFLRLAESHGEAPDFRYDGGISYTSGIIDVSMDLLFETLEDYHVYFRESGSAAINVADIYFRPDGTVIVESNGGTSLSLYTAGTTYLLAAKLDLDAETMDVLLNGTPITTGQGIDDVFGSAVIGFEFSGFNPGPNQDGNMQVDNFRMTLVPEPTTILLFGTGLLGLVGLGRKRFRKN
jgi:hypothetical protein